MPPVNAKVYKIQYLTDKFDHNNLHVSCFLTTHYRDLYTVRRVVVCVQGDR